MATITSNTFSAKIVNQIKQKALPAKFYTSINARKLSPCRKMDDMIQFLDENLKNADLDTVTKADLKKKYMEEKGLNTFSKEEKKRFSIAVGRVLDKYATMAKANESSETENELREIFDKEDNSATMAESNGEFKGKRKLSTSSEDEDFYKAKRGKRKKQAKVSSDDESNASELPNGSKELSGSLNAKKENVNAKGKKRKLSGETADRRTKKVHVISSDSEEDASEEITKKKHSIDSEDESLGALAFTESEEDSNLSKSSINSKKLGKEKLDENEVNLSTLYDPKDVSISKAVEDPNTSGDELLSNLKNKDSSDSEDEPLIIALDKESIDSEDEPLTSIKKKDSSDSEDEPLTNLKKRDSSDSEDESLTNLKKRDSSDSEDEPLTNIMKKDSSYSKKNSSKLAKKDSSDSEDEPLIKLTKNVSSDSEDEPLSKLKQNGSSDSASKVSKDSSDSEDEPLTKVASKSESRRKSAILTDSEEEQKTSRKSSTSSKTKAQKMKHAERVRSKSSRRSDGESSDEEKVMEESKSKEKTDSKKKVNPSEKKLEGLKKYIRAAGIRVPSYLKLFENCKTMKSKHQKLIDLLEEHGMKGRPTLAKCKKLKEKIETAREIAELDKSKIIPSKGRPKRNACADVSNRKDTVESVATPLKEFSRLKGIVDSD